MNIPKEINKKPRKDEVIGGGHFIMRRWPNGRAKAGYLPYEHPTLMSAMEQAEVKAKENPGVEFIVVSQTASRKADAE